MSSENTGFEIAIIGMGGRFPGSRNISELWKNLCEGKNLITHFSDEELLKNGVPEAFINDPSYVKARGIIEDEDKFDAELFGFYPKEVEVLDPQQRLFLECSREALEDAGYKPNSYDGMVGVFGGIGMNTYVLQFLNSTDLVASAEAYQLSIGNDKDFVTTRVSYKLNLNGPSLDIQTACSTSLVSAHVACMNLLNYQCDLALAGGATISLPQINGYHYQEGMILSPDGFCRPFDNDAGGTVASNGVGIVVLKRLQDAIDDKDHIYAVIKGSAYNNDGAVKVGYTAPGVNGQSEVIASAYGMADVPLESIGYIEAHGTGTSLGDPIEIDALNQTFSHETDKKQFCALGSVKSNLGHLDTAAGITGLIKAALSVYHGKIVPSINYSKPNSKINFSETPFYVNTKLKEWESNGYPRRAGVSSFGIGGTNVHAVLEQPPSFESTPDNDDYLIYPISAKSKQSMELVKNDLSKFFIDNAGVNLVDSAYTLQMGREDYEHREIIVANKIETLIEKLSSSNKTKNSGAIIESPSVVFMFSGQGSQYVDMCKNLYENNVNFRSYADECFNVLMEDHDLKLKEIIYPSLIDNNSSEKLKQTEFTQPALFVVEYALAKTLIDLGIIPNIMVGHSIGEYVASCLAGVMNLKSALKIVCKRGALMQKLEKGTMLSVTLSESELKEILPDDLDLSVINSPNLCVVSGTDNNIQEFEKLLTEKEISSAFLHTSHAFHSRMMDPVLDEFKEIVSSVNLSEPRIPYMSNVTGNLISAEEAVNPNYYVNHLRYTVRFAENINNLLDDSSNIFIEVGPGSTLTSLTKLCGDTKNKYIVSSTKHPNENIDDIEKLYTAIGSLWLAGLRIDWTKFHDNTPRRVHLPTYAFDKKRYWLKQSGKAGNRKNIIRSENDWIYGYSWKSKHSSKPINLDTDSNYVIFEDESNPISSILLERGIESENIIKVIPAAEFESLNNSSFKINPSVEEHFEILFKSLMELEKSNIKIVHSWQHLQNENFEANSVAYLSIINISRIISKFDKRFQLFVITNNLFNVIGSEKIAPQSATIIGALKVVPQEYKNIDLKLVDCSTESNQNGNFSECTVNELIDTDEHIVALRGLKKWIPCYDNIQINDSNSLLEDKGVYIITGGLGRIALTFAEHIAKNYNANLILLDQVDFHKREKWDNLIKNNDIDKSQKAKINKLQEIEQYANSLSIVKCDVSNKEELLNEAKKIASRFEKLNGIIHTAAVVGEATVNLINDFDIKNFERQAEPKIIGTNNLAFLSENIPVDFILIQSSLSSILGGLGFANYSAVNNYVDSFVSQQNYNKNTKWISVNWDAWKFDENEKGIDESAGCRMLDRILNYDAPNNIIISKGDLNESIEKWISNNNFDGSNNSPEVVEGHHDRPELDTEYIEPKTDLEIKICAEWKQLIGIEKIGINDNFFELGGDSLIGTQLVSRMRKEFNVEIPLVSVFQNATIAGIAQLIEENSSNGSDSEKVDDVLDLITNMSDEEVKKMLEEKGNI